MELGTVLHLSVPSSSDQLQNYNIQFVNQWGKDLDFTIAVI